MDRALFFTCLSVTSTIVANTGKMVNMHHQGAKSVVVEAALQLYDEIEQLIADRENTKPEFSGNKEQERDI